MTKSSKKEISLTSTAPSSWSARILLPLSGRYSLLNDKRNRKYIRAVYFEFVFY